MALGSILQFLENKTILVTGATGFLAKIFVEKILRVQSNVKMLYLLLRATDAKSAEKRFHNELIGEPLFNVLKEQHGARLHSFISEKVRLVPGDISYEDFVVKDSLLREQMRSEIDMVVNFAANTKFNERYEVALGTNTFGALHILNFVKKCVKVKLLVHVSTAYVCGKDAGLILEKPFVIGKAKKGSENIDIDLEKELVKEKLRELQSTNAAESEITSCMKNFGLERARRYGWPNTYVFTKTMGEMLLGHFKDHIPLVIIRPSMILSTIKEPFPGWIEDPRTIDTVILGYAKGKLKRFPCNQNLILDVVPADMVVNAIIVAMVEHAKQPATSEIIYHVGSSLRNPLTFSNLQKLLFRYFTQNPLIAKDGKPIKIVKDMTSGNMANFRMYMAIRFSLPLKVFQLANAVLFQKYRDKCVDLDRNLKRLMRLAELYKPYGLFKGIFDDSNLEKLQIATKEKYSDIDAFNFDPVSIKWEAYMMEVHFSGLIKYVMK